MSILTPALKFPAQTCWSAQYVFKDSRHLCDREHESLDNMGINVDSALCAFKLFRQQK